MIDEIGWEPADAFLWASFNAHGDASALGRLRDDLRRWRLLYRRSLHGIPYAQLYIELHRATMAQFGEGDDVVGAPLPLCPLPLARREAQARRKAPEAKAAGDPAPEP